MPFGGFANLQDVARRYDIVLRSGRFLDPTPTPVDKEFQKRLEYIRDNAPVTASEEAICEFLIAPILQEMWLAYSESLMIWSHVHFGDESPLQGNPDYFFCRRSPLGRVM